MTVAAQRLRELAAQILALPPPDQLRAAAELLERGNAQLAHTIAERVVTELGAAIALRRLSEAEVSR